MNSFIKKRKLNKNYIFKNDLIKHKKLFEPFTTTLEVYNLDSVSVLKSILSDMLLTEESVTNRSYLKKRLQLLNRLTSENRLTVNFDKIVRKVTAGYLRPSRIGRIYPKGMSLSCLTRDLRHYLCEGSYFDYDLVNSHPSILYDFVCNNTRASVPFLKLLVMHRDEFMQKVHSEAKPKDVKRSILIALNYDHRYTSNSKLLRGLHTEVILIRKLLLEFLIRSEKRYLKKSTSYIISAKILTRVQSYYCMTKESELLNQFREFLVSQIKNSMTLYPDRVFEESDLHFIPIFDGALIKHEDFIIHGFLERYVELFNKSLPTYFKFKKKELELPEDCLIDKETYRKYAAIHNFVKTLGHQQMVNLLEKLDIEPFSLEQEVLNNITTDLKKKKDTLNELHIELKKQKRKKVGGSLVEDLREKIKSTKKAGFLEPRDFNILSTNCSIFSQRVRSKLLEATHGEDFKLAQLISDNHEKP